MSQPAKSTRLTVAMIVRDAEDLLRDSLESIESIADEIVIADTGSADKTIDVANEFGAKVVEREWSDDFSAARNFCLKHVTGDWILWLDAGDRLSAADAARFREQIDTNPTLAAAYLMFVEIPPNATNAAERIAQVRLAPKHPLIKFQGRVRETMIDSLTTAQVGIEPLDVCICRSSREHERNIKTAKAKRNIRLAEADIRDSGLKPELLNCLGDAFQTLEDHDRAIQFFRHALQASQPGSPDMLEAFYGIVTSLDGKPEQRDEQLATCMRALEAYPMDAQLLCAMGGYLQAQGQTELAMKAYQTTCQHGQVNPGVWHVSNIHEIATVCWSLTLQLLGRQDLRFHRHRDRITQAARVRPDHLQTQILLHLVCEEGLGPGGLQPAEQVSIDPRPPLHVAVLLLQFARRADALLASRNEPGHRRHVHARRLGPNSPPRLPARVGAEALPLPDRIGHAVIRQRLGVGLRLARAVQLHAHGLHLEGTRLALLAHLLDGRQGRHALEQVDQVFHVDHDLSASTAAE